jgi:RNA polymerase sigma-70 factor (ECF subfamily)
MVGVSGEDRWRAWIAGTQRPEESTTADPETVLSLLEQIVSTARAAHPNLDVDELAFVTHVRRSVSSLEPHHLDALRCLHAADLWLAFACAYQIAGAPERFSDHCHSVTDQTLRRMGIAGATMEDMKQQLSEKLFASRDCGRSRFLAYAGRGPLTAWVAISLQRIAQSFRRHEASARVRHQAVAREGQAGAVSPELLLLKNQYRTEFSQAFAAAFAGLSDRERTILRLHLLGRLRLDQIAPMFQVDASTISRWLTTARASILAQSRRLLADRLRVSTREFTSIARLLRSQIDVSLSSLLNDDSVSR